MTSSYDILFKFTCKCPHRALLFHSRSSFHVVNGPSDFFQCSSQTSQNSCGKRNRQHSRICRTWFKLIDNRMAIGHERATLLRLRHSSSRQRFQGSHRHGALTPAMMRIFMQKTTDHARFANDRFPSTTSVGSIRLQGSWKTSGLVESWITSP